MGSSHHALHLQHSIFLRCLFDSQRRHQSFSQLSLRLEGERESSCAEFGYGGHRSNRTGDRGSETEGCRGTAGSLHPKHTCCGGRRQRSSAGVGAGHVGHVEERMLHHRLTLLNYAIDLQQQHVKDNTFAASYGVPDVWR